MFRRRKPADEPEPKMDQTQISTSRDTPVPTPLDTGLGVPPRPPAAPPTPATFKEPLMGRPPFAAPTPNGSGNPQASSGNPPMPQSVPPRPPGPPSPPAMVRPAREAPQASTERRTLVVGRGISVQGMVQDAERLVVEGTVEANMIHASELSISPGGVFKGEVEVEEAEVAGTIDGTLTARGALVIRHTGVLLGTARCRRLQVEDGGQITGRIEMLTESARTPAEPVRQTPSPVPAPILSYES